jgi:hypothetical protein
VLRLAPLRSASLPPAVSIHHKRGSRQKARMGRDPIDCIEFCLLKAVLALLA